MERENGENICIFLVYLGMLHTMLISCLFSTRRTRYIVYMLCVFFPLITESYEVESNDHKIKCERVKLFVCIAKKELVNRAYSSTLYAKKRDMKCKLNLCEKLSWLLLIAKSRKTEPTSKKRISVFFSSVRVLRKFENSIQRKMKFISSDISNCMFIYFVKYSLCNTQ